jgi:hypothetical protein
MRTQAPELSAANTLLEFDVLKLKHTAGCTILLAMVVLRLLAASNAGMCTLRHLGAHCGRKKDVDAADGSDAEVNSSTTSSNTALPAGEARVNARVAIMLGCSHNVTKCEFRKEKYMKTGLRMLENAQYVHILFGS